MAGVVQTEATPTPEPVSTPEIVEAEALRDQALIAGDFEGGQSMQETIDGLRSPVGEEEVVFPTLEPGFEKKFNLALREWLLDKVTPASMEALLSDSKFIAAMRAQFENVNIQALRNAPDPDKPVYVKTGEFLGTKIAPFASLIDESLVRQGEVSDKALATKQVARNKAFLDAPEEALAGALLSSGRVTDVGGPFGTSPARQAAQMADLLADDLAEFFSRASARARQAGQGEPEFQNVLQQFVTQLPQDSSLLSLQEREAGGPLETIAEIGNVQRRRAFDSVRFNQFADIDPFSLVEQNLRSSVPELAADDLSRRASRLTPIIQNEYQRVVDEALAAGNIPEDLNSFIQRLLEERGPVFTVKEASQAEQAGFGGERGFGGRRDPRVAERNVQFGLGRPLTEAIEGRDEADIEFGAATGSVAGDNALLDAFIEANRDDLDTRFRAAKRSELDAIRQDNFATIFGPAIAQEGRQNESLTSSLETLGGARPEAVGAGVLGALKGERAKRQVDFFGQSIEPNLASAQAANRSEEGTLTRETFLRREKPRLLEALEATPQARERQRLSNRPRRRTRVNQPI